MKIYKIWDGTSGKFLTGGANPRWTKNGKNFVEKRQAEAALERALSNLINTAFSYAEMAKRHRYHERAKEQAKIYNAMMVNASENWYLETYRLTNEDQNDSIVKTRIKELRKQAKRKLKNDGWLHNRNRKLWNSSDYA